MDSASSLWKIQASRGWSGVLRSVVVPCEGAFCDQVLVVVGSSWTDMVHLESRRLDFLLWFSGSVLVLMNGVSENLPREPIIHLTDAESVAVHPQQTPATARKGRGEKARARSSPGHHLWHRE